jgi:hypothetical protein
MISRGFLLLVAECHADSPKHQARAIPRAAAADSFPQHAASFGFERWKRVGAGTVTHPANPDLL